MLELVNEVLDISRIDSGNMNAHARAAGPWTNSCANRIDLIRPLADVRRIDLTHPGAGSILTPVTVSCWPTASGCGRWLLNLLSNAVKYNRERGRVTLDSGPAPDGKRLRLSVLDTGRGIAAENLPLLFTPFERLGAENTDVEGSGIGLALSKRLVESQGGELGVESECGAGTMFWLDLPVAAAPLADATPVRLEELFGEVMLPGDANGNPAQMFRDGVAESSVPPSRVVLYIEDNEPNRRLVEMLMMQRPSWRLLTAARGTEGLELAREHRPDLILLDLHLPDVTGEAVLQQLRSETATLHTPVVMVSADAAAMRRNQERGTGADDYLTKPFNVGEFLRILDRYLDRNGSFAGASPLKPIE